MLEDHPLSGTQIRGHRIGSHDVDLPILVRPTCRQASEGKLVLAIGRAQRIVNTRSALSRKGKRARGRDGDQRRLPLRRCALHHRGRPDQRNCLSLPGLPKFTGSAFAALVRVPKEALTIEATLRSFTSLGGSGNPIPQDLCAAERVIFEHRICLCEMILSLVRDVTNNRGKSDGNAGRE